MPQLTSAQRWTSKIEYVNPNAWSARAKPRKTSIQEDIVDLVEVTSRWLSLHRGLNVVTLAGPNVKKVVELYSRLLGKGSIYSAEVNRRVYEIQMREFGKLRLRDRSRISIQSEDWFSLARMVVRKSLPTFLDMDFCSTIDVEWNGSLSKLGSVMEAVNPSIDVMFASMTHCNYRRRCGFEDRKTFFAEKVPHFFSVRGWSVIHSLVTGYKDQNGPPMYTSFYGLKRKD